MESIVVVGWLCDGWGNSASEIDNNAWVGFRPGLFLNQQDCTDDGPDGVTLNYSNGIELKLGREDTLKRVQRFIDLYPSISKHKAEAIEQVDLRYDTGLAVRFAPAPVQPEKRKA
jgi:cell division septal protein FtsQ